MTRITTSAFIIELINEFFPDEVTGPVETGDIIIFRAKNISSYDASHERKALTALCVQFQTERRCYQ